MFRSTNSKASRLVTTRKHGCTGSLGLLPNGTKHTAVSPTVADISNHTPALDQLKAIVARSLQSEAVSTANAVRCARLAPEFASRERQGQQRHETQT